MLPVKFYVVSIATSHSTRIAQYLECKIPNLKKIRELKLSENSSLISPPENRHSNPLANNFYGKLESTLTITRFNLLSVSAISSTRIQKQTLTRRTWNTSYTDPVCLFFLNTNCIDIKDCTISVAVTNIISVTELTANSCQH